jgi:hypothetical protein
MMDVTRELAVLFWLVAAGLVATVAAIVVLMRRGRTVPPFAATATHDSPPQQRTKRPRKWKWPLLPERAGRT